MTNSYPSGSPGAPDSGMPTGAPGFMPQRSSYASVVSGIAAVMAGSIKEDQDREEDNYQASQVHLAHLQMDMVMVGIIGHADHFFVPSYLKRSKYVQNLEEAHKAKIRAHRDGSAPSSQPNSLSTSASSTNLHAKMVPSHRGRPYDLIEKSPLVEDETLPPLPSRWSSTDKYGALEIMSDGLEVKLTGPKSMNDRDLEACSIRSDNPMPPQCGIYYFEVTILSRKREDSSIGIGFSTKQVPLSRLPGWEPDSWAYHGDDGHAYGCSTSGKIYGPSFNTDDTIGYCLGTAFHNINGKGKLFPSIGMKKPGEHIRVNFGQSPFVFDIDGMILREERQIKK
ncbi:hypothetical protein DID88_003249 [Monilinia fructigena]|uniref:B30.2/SPRY domain-containing protein n=1 Tax=Monilinia fructigena TaxID=38457 RepID=A0A395IV83_9HELO|nr:hypothetical protein DID88_003249 [Monilinia fructigena]